jgi:hypothetical protein
MESLFFSSAVVKDSELLFTVVREAENCLVALMELTRFRCILSEIAAFAALPDCCIVE